MELIKKIKQAETQAREIIEQAKTRAAKQAEETSNHRLEILTEAEQERKKAIEAAITAAQSQGVVEVGDLKTKAKKDSQGLRDKVADKMAGAVEKVTDYLRG